MQGKVVTKAFLLLFAFFFGLYSYSAVAAGDNSGAHRRPNILLIIGDDIGLDVSTNMYPGLIDKLVKQYGPSGHNHPDYKKIKGRPASTPVLDQFAKQGMRFSNAWAHPFCSPTRATIITGVYAAKTKVTTYADPLSKYHTTFVEKLKEAGYSTAIFGKWHLAGLRSRNGGQDFPGIKPKQAGFDLYKGNLNAAIRTYWDYNYEVQDDKTAPNEWREEKPPLKSLPGIKPTTFAPVVKVADTVEWIEGRQAAAPDKPWFAWLAFNLSHATIKREPSQMAVPDADTLDAATYNELKACGGVFGTQDRGNCSGEAQMRGMTNALDTVVGKLLDVVDKIPDTYVIYIADNGTPMYGRPHLDFIDNMYITRKGRGKGTGYESGARVAMAIKGPGIKANSQSDEFVHAADIFSTVIKLAGLTPPKQVTNAAGNGTVPLDSVSLTPILFNKATSVRDPNKGYTLAETKNLMTGGTSEVGARNATYKVMCTNSADNCEFYNLVDDPLEEYPLARPDSCASYKNGKWTPADPQWHYCRLTEVVVKYSFLSEAEKK